MRTHTTSANKDPREATIKNFLIVFFVLALLIFLYDGFAVHCIPAPESTFSGSSLSKDYSPLSTGEPFEGATLLDSDRAHSDFLTYLLDYEGETHLLLYEFHFITRRGNLVADIIVDPNVDQAYEVKAFLCRYKIPVSGGKLGDMQVYGLYKNGPVIYSPQMLVYFAAAFVLALAESAVYVKLRKKKAAA